MEPPRFDALTRLVARSASRRTFAGAVAAALAPLGAAARPEPAGCRPNGRRCTLPPDETRHGKGKRGGKGKHRPTSCSKCCSRQGAAGSDGKARCACKSERIACDNPSQCCSGDCRNGTCTACPPDTVFCLDGCANLQSDPRHCGSCDKACDAGQSCVSGTCVCDATSCPRGCCDAAGACQRGTRAGACGVGGTRCSQCDPGQCCDGAVCVCDDASCPDGCCDGAACVPFAKQTAALCGTGGAACAACTNSDTCGGGGAPGVCGCTPNCTNKCGGADDGCGGTCTADCPAGRFCLSQACLVGQGSCHAGDNYCSAGGGHVLCDGTSPGTFGCDCYQSIEGATRCGATGFLFGTGCTSSAECAAAHPAVPGIFCAQKGIDCGVTTCYKPCPQ